NACACSAKIPSSAQELPLHNNGPARWLRGGLLVEHGVSAGGSRQLLAGEPPDNEHEQGTTDRDGHAAQVEAGDIAEPELSADKATDHRPGDAEQDGENDAARLLAGHEELGERPRDQSEHDPQQDAHGQVSHYEVSRSVPPLHEAGPIALPIPIV